MRAETRIQLEDEVVGDLRELVTWANPHRLRFLKVTSAMYTVLIRHVERYRDKYCLDLEYVGDGEEHYRRHGMRFRSVDVIPDCERLEMVF